MERGTTKVELMKLGALQQSRQNRGPPQLIRQNGNTEHREIRVDLRCHIKTDRVLKGVLHGRNKSGRMFQANLYGQFRANRKYIKNLCGHIKADRQFRNDL